ncbi:porin [Salegentibacter sp. F188]|uniref:Porin n=1 Tax=Autumnicola patrickiae TaxID=3075591 RepID=A0ABU3DXH1_9FLAO|nr:porin [Salegentibacter sp. F188]MDT0688154.1 porin [Salegentibacter sp. F188]
MRYPWHLLLAFFLVGVFNTKAQETVSNQFGKGLINFTAKDSSFSVKFAPRFQSLYTSQWDYPESGKLERGNSNMLVRRARLKFSGFAYSPKLKYKLELGLSNNDISGASAYTGNAPRYILDAVLQWNFYDNFELWLGQTKLPGNRERVISSANMQTVDRSLVNSRFNIDREAGAQLRHFFYAGDNVLFKEVISVSQGEGRNVTTGNIGGHHIVARAEILPFGDFKDYVGADLEREPLPKLSVGASYSFNNNAVRTNSISGSYMLTNDGFHTTDITTYFLDLMFKYRGLNLMAEAARRTADEPFALNEDGSPTGDMVQIGDGINIQAGYVFKNDYEIVGRYTGIDLKTNYINRGIEKQYTLGLSKYIVGHKLKVQTDLSYNNFDNSADDGLMYRFQVDIHF